MAMPTFVTDVFTNFAGSAQVRGRIGAFRPKQPMKKKALAAQVASDRAQFTELEQLPNVGPAVAADLRKLDIQHPADLRGRDAYQMYDNLCRVTGKRHDPCMLDTFIAIVRFMGGEPAKPWWAYTAERKRRLKKSAPV